MDTQNIQISCCEIKCTSNTEVENGISQKSNRAHFDGWSQKAIKHNMRVKKGGDAICGESLKYLKSHRKSYRKAWLKPKLHTQSDNEISTSLAGFQLRVAAGSR